MAGLLQSHSPGLALSNESSLAIPDEAVHALTRAKLMLDSHDLTGTLQSIICAITLPGARVARIL